MGIAILVFRWQTGFADVPVFGVELHSSMNESKLRTTPPRIAVGLSGGHTRSQIIAIKDGNVIGSAQDKGLNHHLFHDPVDLRNAVLRLFDGMLESTMKYTTEKFESFSHFLKQIEYIGISMPGITTEKDRDFVAVAFSQFEIEDKEIVDDTWANLIACTNQTRGISVIAGTGASVCIGFDVFRLGKQYKLDGFG
jgi:N-acetylglucosamine kinase-like BadF-type ATPase